MLAWLCQRNTLHSQYRGANVAQTSTLTIQRWSRRTNQHTHHLCLSLFQTQTRAHRDTWQAKNCSGDILIYLTHTQSKHNDPYNTDTQTNYVYLFLISTDHIDAYNTNLHTICTLHTQQAQICYFYTNTHTNYSSHSTQAHTWPYHTNRHELNYYFINNKHI